MAKPIELAGTAGRELEQGEGDEAERQAVGNADRERHRDDRQKCGNPSVRSSHWMCRTLSIIITPTSTSAGATTG